MSVETRNGDCDIKEWGWWWQWWIIRSPHLKSTKAPFCLRPLLILQNDQLFRFWSRMYWHFLPTNLLEFLLQCKLVLWKTRGPKLVSMTEIVYRNFLLQRKSSNIWSDVLILIFQIKLKKDSTLDLKTKSWSVLFQLHFQFEISPYPLDFKSPPRFDWFFYIQCLSSW